MLLGVFTGLAVKAQPSVAQSLTSYFASQPGNHSDADFGAGYQLRTDTLRAANGAGTVVRFFPNGQKQEEMPYSNLRKQELHGTQTRWFESGQVQASEQYANNQRHGQLLTYYPDGKLRRREEYVRGIQVKSECFTLGGQSAACVEYMQFPEYPGGLSALLRTISRTTQYPKDALKQGQNGLVRVRFVIGETGQVQQAQVVQSVAPLLDAEALRVVNALRGWTPGRLDGEAAPVVFTLPVTFAIR